MSHVFQLPHRPEDELENQLSTSIYVLNGIVSRKGSLESFYNIHAVQTSYKASHTYRAMAVKYGCTLLLRVSRAFVAIVVKQHQDKH